MSAVASAAMEGVRQRSSDPGTASTDLRRGPRRSRRRRTGWWTAATLLALVVVGTAVVAALDLRAAQAALRTAERSARQAQSALLDGDIAAAAAAFGDAERAFAAAAARLDRRSVRLVAALPLAGRNLEVVRVLTDAGLLVAGAGERATSAILDLPGGAAALAPSQGQLPVEHIASLAPALEEAAAQVRRADERVAATPSTLLAGPVAQARQAFTEQLATIREPVRAGGALAGVLPAYLGADGPRRYFFGAQNPAEARGTGGLIGAWAVLTVDRGRLEFSDFETISTLTLPPDQAAEVPPPTPDYGARYGEFAAAGHGSNINMTPDAPTAAEAILTLHERQRGERLDGVVLADPFAFEALLRLTGPVEVPGVRQVDADTVVEFLTNTQWAEFPEDAARKPLLGDVARTTLEGLLRGGSGDPARSLQVLGEAAGAGHLVLHSAVPDEQRAFVDAGVAGAFVGRDRGGSDALFAVVVNNAAANKLDSYLEQDIDYEVWLDASGDAYVRATVTLANTAPREGPGQTVLGPNADGLSAGEHRVYLSTYCGWDCGLESFARDGRAQPVSSERELGAAVFPTTVAIPSGGRQTLAYEWRVSSAWDGTSFRLAVPGQALPSPARLTVTVHPPVGGALRPELPRSAHEVQGRVVWQGSIGRRLELAVRRAGR